MICQKNCSEICDEPKVALNSSSSRLPATSADQAVLRRFLLAHEVKLVAAAWLAAEFMGQRWAESLTHNFSTWGRMSGLHKVYSFGVSLIFRTANHKKYAMSLEWWTAVCVLDKSEELQYFVGHRSWIGCKVTWDGKFRERFPPYLIYASSRFPLLTPTALMWQNQSNLLVVFLGLTLLWVRVIIIGHLSRNAGRDWPYGVRERARFLIDWIYFVTTGVILFIKTDVASSHYVPGLSFSHKQTTSDVWV